VRAIKENNKVKDSEYWGKARKGREEGYVLDWRALNSLLGTE
jgi:hypothetical protein